MPDAPPLPPDVTWIDTDDLLAEAVADLAGASSLAIDTEADSYYAYKVKVCLVQVSTRNRHYLIDPLAGIDLASLGQLCRDPDIEKVFHAGGNDVGLLRFTHGFEFQNLFDTMVAAQVLGLPRTGLAPLLEERFEVRTSKAYQTSDWRRRPLSAGQLEYAALDTRYLAELRDQLIAELEMKGRMNEALQEFDRLRFAEYSERVYDPESFRRARGGRDLDDLALRVLSELFDQRERIAEKRDRSPHRVFPDRILVEIARQKPRSASDLDRISGFPRWQQERFGTLLVRTVQKALGKGPMPPPQRKRGRSRFEPPLGDRQKQVFEELRNWRRQRAASRAVDEARVATTGTLRAIAREAPTTLEELAQIPGMLPFRVEEFGEEILTIIRNGRAGSPR